MLILLPRVFAQPRPKADISRVQIPQRSSTDVCYSFRAREVLGMKGLLRQRRRGPSPNLQKELDQRTSELAEARKHLAEALDQQTARNEILGAIVASPSNIQAGLEAIQD